MLSPIPELRTLADEGDGWACLLLGELYVGGEIPADPTEGIAWFARGAELGNLPCAWKMSRWSAFEKGLAAHSCGVIMNPEARDHRDWKMCGAPAVNWWRSSPPLAEGRFHYSSLCPEHLETWKALYEGPDALVEERDFELLDDEGARRRVLEEL